MALDGCGLPTWEESSSNFEEDMVHHLDGKPQSTSGIASKVLLPSSRAAKVSTDGAARGNDIFLSPIPSQRLVRDDEPNEREQRRPHQQHHHQPQSQPQQQQSQHSQHSHYQQQQQQQQQHLMRNESTTSQRPQRPGGRNYSTSSDREIERERDRDNEIFACREFMLSAAERTKFLSELTHRIEEHVNAECNLEAASLKQLLATALRYGGSLVSARKLPECLPKEGRIVEDHNNELDASLRSMLRAIAECMGNRNATYLAQLKKCRELSNAATRNAVQAERAQSHVSLQRLRAKMDADAEATKSEQRRQTDAHNAECSTFRSAVLELRNDKTRLEGLLESAQADKERAVASAVRELRDQLEAQEGRHQKYMHEEAARVKQAVEREVEAFCSQLQSQADVAARHGDEIRSLLAADKKSLEAELVQVRQQLVQALAQVTVEREVATSRVVEARALGERDAQEARADSLRLQSALKADLAENIQRARAEDKRRIDEFEMVLVKDREAHATAFALDAERTAERHRAEMRRMQANLEVRQQEDVARLKHVHEQEVKRLLRENDRLQRTLARGTEAGGGDRHAYLSSDEPSQLSHHGHRYRSSASEAEGDSGSFHASHASPVHQGGRGNAHSAPHFSASPGERKERHPLTLHASQSLEQTLDQSMLPEQDFGVDMARTLRGSVDPEPCPPPPPPLQSAALNWGALNASLLSQQVNSIWRLYLKKSLFS